MKYIVLLGDGMADHAQAELGGKTPLEVANIPTFDKLARLGEVGMTYTIPEGMAPGSDVANTAVLGYNPKENYSGRSPLEAVSMGIPLEDTDVTFRCNLVTLTDEAALEDTTILDHSSGEITSEEAKELILALREGLDFGDADLYPGVSYRHCLVFHHAMTGTEFTPPHDITGQPVKGHLPTGRYGEKLTTLMQASRKILANHPVNLRRQEKGLNPANACWFWGEGTKPALGDFKSIYGKTGGVISAVDLLKGIGICAGLEAPHVENATGTLHTNYQGKLEASLAILEKHDFVYIHFEGPDECGHQGNAKEKIQAIEWLDEKCLAPLMQALDDKGEDYNILLMPDHATPLELRTHTAEAIPYILYKKNQTLEHHAEHYDENHAKATGKVEEKAWDLMARLLA